MTLKHWKKLNQKTIFNNHYWTYNLDEFEIEDGHNGEYHYVHTLGSTMVIPVTAEKKFLLLNQFRYLNQKESLEFPCGSIEEGFSPEENALKELQEESGFSAGKLKLIGEFSPYNGVSDELCSVYIAKELFPSSHFKSDLTEEFELVERSFEEIEELIRQNIIWDGMTISAWTLAKYHL